MADILTPWSDDAADFDSELLQQWARQWKSLDEQSDDLFETIQEAQHKLDRMLKEMRAIEVAARQEIEDMKRNA